MKKQGHFKQHIEYNFQHSVHSNSRANERDIRDEDIQVALNYSETFFKQGLIFHVVKDKLIPNNLPPRVSSRIRNLVVVIAGDEGRVLTCYRSHKAFARIKRKPKRLARYSLEAYQHSA